MNWNYTHFTSTKHKIRPQIGEWKFQTISDLTLHSQSPRWFHLFHEKTRHFSQSIIWTAPWLSLSPRKTLTSFFFYFLCFVDEAFVSVILDPQNWNGHLRQADMNPKLFLKVKLLFEKSSAGVTESKIRHLRNWNSNTILKTLERVERVPTKKSTCSNS